MLNVYPLISSDFGVERPGYECTNAAPVTRRRPEHVCHRAKRAQEEGRLIQKTASQIVRSTNIRRSIALLEQLVAAVGGPRKLLELWRAECLKLTSLRRSSTRLARMYEMLVVLAGQVRTRTDKLGAGSRRPQ